MIAAGVLLGLRLLSPDPEERDALTIAIDDVVETAMEEGHISGVSVAVSRGLRILHQRGYGYADLENELEATPLTVYQVGSITKQFTAASIMLLVEDGEIDLDAPVTEYLPDYTGFADVTVRQLLSHTSGVTNYTTIESWWRALGVEVTPTMLAEVFRSEPRDFPPGRRFSYSNSGYVLLGLILEAVSGQPYGGFLNEHVIVPHGLERTAYCDDRRLIPGRASGYQIADDEWQHAPYVSMSQAYAAGGICSTVIDLLRWTRALSNGSIVENRSYDQMSTPSALADGTPIEYGFGLAVSYLDGHHRITHIGGMLGFTGQVSHYDEDGVTVAVLTNTEDANAAKIESDIARIVLGLDDRVVQDLPLTVEQTAMYTGRYDLGVAEIDVEAADGRLFADVALPGVEGHYVFLYQGDDTFQAADDAEITVTFTVVDGRAEEFVLLRRGITTRATRVQAP